MPSGETLGKHSLKTWFFPTEKFPSSSLALILSITGGFLFLLLLLLGFLCYALKDQSSSNYVRLSRAVSAISQIKLLGSSRASLVAPENDEAEQEQSIHLQRISKRAPQNGYPNTTTTLPEVIAEDEYCVRLKSAWKVSCFWTIQLTTKCFSVNLCPINWNGRLGISPYCSPE